MIDRRQREYTAPPSFPPWEHRAILFPWASSHGWLQQHQGSWSMDDRVNAFLLHHWEAQVFNWTEFRHKLSPDAWSSLFLLFSCHILRNGNINIYWLRKIHLEWLYGSLCCTVGALMSSQKTCTWRCVLRMNRCRKWLDITWKISRRTNRDKISLF